MMILLIILLTEIHKSLKMQSKRKAKKIENNSCKGEEIKELKGSKREKA